MSTRFDFKIKKGTVNKSSDRTKAKLFDEKMSSSSNGASKSSGGTRSKSHVIMMKSLISGETMLMPASSVIESISRTVAKSVVKQC